jgi:hypothetical protein
MLLPHAQHRQNDVQRTYMLQQRRIHHHAKPSKPYIIKSNPARKEASQASVCVSTVIKVKSESNSTVIQSNQNRIRSSQPVTVNKRISHPSIGVFVIRNQSQIRIEFDPATPASNTSVVITVSSASHVQFVVPIGIPKMSGAGSSVCTTTRSRRCRCRCRTYNHNMIPVSQ